MRQVDKPLQNVNGGNAGLRRGRIVQLDVLRGVAILMVLWTHQVVPPERAGFMRPVAALGARFGWSGVDLFFVLSGFLIGGLLFKELAEFGRLNLGRFWIRRGLKIWPGYYCLMAVVFLSIGRQEGARKAFVAILPSLFALQNYLWIARAHTWSLAVEEHFYLVLPLLLVMLPKRVGAGKMTIPALAPIVLLVALAGLGLRLALTMRHPDMQPVKTSLTHLNIDGMFAGVFLAYLKQFHFEAFARWACRPELAVLGAALLSPMFFAHTPVWFVVGVGHTLTYMGYSMILIHVVQTPLGQGWLGRLLAGPVARLLAFVGFYSYSIYLWFPDSLESRMYYFFEHHNLRVPAGEVWIMAMSVYVAGAVAVGVIMAKLIEIPMLARRNRWFPPRESITPASPRASSLAEPGIVPPVIAPLPRFGGTRG